MRLYPMLVNLNWQKIRLQSLGLVRLKGSLFHHHCRSHEVILRSPPNAVFWPDDFSTARL